MDVALLPAELDKLQVEGCLAVVIDVLRASTTIVTALARGAREVIPCETVAEARNWKEHEPQVLLCGERNANPLPGFALGNSPREYTAAAVGGRRVVLTTTNGTVALRAAIRAGAARIVVGGLNNRAAVAEFCRGWDGNLVMICAGTRGLFALEDAIAAGAIITLLPEDVKLSDGARVCRTLFMTWSRDLAHVLSTTDHGRRLAAQGYAADIPLAAQLDAYREVPVYDGNSLKSLRINA